MRITDTGSTGRVANSNRKKNTGSGVTFSIETDAAGSQAGLSAPTSTSSIGSLLSLQAIGDPLEGRRRSVSFGHELLDELDSLKVSLLSGEMTSTQIKKLVTLVENRPRSDAEKLEAVISEIELRAKVELAKLGQK
jgi:hypothetical protein